MNTTVSIFNQFNYEDSAVRVIRGDEGQPWFCAIDVCAILKHSNHHRAVKMHCMAKGVTKRTTLTNGGIQELTYISESNLIRLIVRSKLPEAVRFEEWVFEQLLPAVLRQMREVVPDISGRPAGDMVTVEKDELIELLQTKVLFLEGKKRRGRARRFTAEELQTIGKLWGVLTSLEIANKLGRDERSILYHANKLGLIGSMVQ
jgi:prophage antirepressor-like protein